jgi:hypothetical protein
VIEYWSIGIWNTTHHSITPILLYSIPVTDNASPCSISPLPGVAESGADTFQCSVGVTLAGCQRDAELARQLRRTFGKQTSGELQTGRGPDLRRRDIRNHEVHTSKIFFVGAAILSLITHRRRFVAKTLYENLCVRQAGGGLQRRLAAALFEGNQWAVSLNR